jgi:hypothetical protein
MQKNSGTDAAASSVSAPPSKKQACAVRRSRVTPETIAHVPLDTWLQICARLHFSPLHVFRLMAASRGIWEALKAHPKWWAHFYQRVMQHQQPTSPYIKMLQRYRGHSDKRRVLKLIFVRVCEACGARQGHTLLHPLMARLCTLCVQHRVVSNRVLLKRYGLHFSDFLLRYYDAGGVLIAHRQNFKKSLDHSTSLLWLTCDPLDFETWHLDRMTGFKHQLLFFSIKDLEAVLGLNLAQEERHHMKRLQAVETIAAHCRMNNARRALGNAYISVQDILVNDRWNRIQSSLRARTRADLMPLMMGGPFMLGAQTPMGYRHMLRLRPGLNDDDLARIRVIVDGAALL